MNRIVGEYCNIIDKLLHRYRVNAPLCKVMELVIGYYCTCADISHPPKHWVDPPSHGYNHHLHKTGNNLWLTLLTHSSFRCVKDVLNMHNTKVVDSWVDIEPYIYP